MRLLSWNVNGLRACVRKGFLQFLDTSAADIIALQEVERNYGPPERPLQPEDISALLPDYYWSFDAAFDIDASEQRADGIGGRGAERPTKTTGTG